MLTIGKLARASHVNIDTIRYSERQGLVLPEVRTAAHFRLYGLESLRRVLFIRKAQGLGFSLMEIAQLMHFGVDPGVTKADVLGLTTQEIEMHQAKIRELEALQHTAPPKTRWQVSHTRYCACNRNSARAQPPPR